MADYQELEWKYEQLIRQIEEARNTLSGMKKEIFSLSYEKEALKEQVEFYHQYLKAQNLKEK